MTQISESITQIIPRSKWWWLGLVLLLLLASWLYLRGYNVSLPYIDHNDEPQHLIAAQHIVDFGHENGVHDQYPPGTKMLTYVLLKHVKPIEAHHVTMLPALRLITITAWMLVIVLVALLGAMVAHPLTGLMAAAIWIVNPWVVERAHWLLPDGYLTLFTLLAVWLALVSYFHGRRSFSTAAVYSIMLAIVFKTQAIFVAPIVILMPLLNWWRMPACRKEAWRQTLWNCIRFAVFLFWLLLIYPTLEADQIVYVSKSYSDISLPSLESAWASLNNWLRTFQSRESWLAIAIAGCLLWRYRQRVNAVALFAVVMAGLAWLLGMSMIGYQHYRHYFAVGAIVALLYACSLTALLYAGQEALSRLKMPSLSQRLRRLVVPCALLVFLVTRLLPSYHRSDALAHNFTLHDRRNDLMSYMDASLPPGKYITDRDGPNHKVFNRSWGGYTGLHDYPLARTLRDLPEESLESWRQNDAVYAIMPYPKNAEDPHIYFPDETVLLKSYPPDPSFRGPSMVVLRLYPMQNKSDGQLGPIRLVGYDINRTQFAAGEDIVLRHYWAAENPTASIHHVYNHLINEVGETVAQVDYVPLWDDRRPTTTWDDPAEILLGREFTLSLPPDLPPGRYQLISGLYDPVTWQRLMSPDGVDHIDIADITITQPEV